MNAERVAPQVGTDAVAPGLRWSVIVPVKSLEAAKTRLAPLAADDRRALALAMALDTVAAALGCAAVDVVVVVTNDAAAGAFRALGARVVADEPDTGLNAAIGHGVTAALADRPGQAVAALAGDLPALQPDELADALAAAARHPRAVLADSSGEGSVLLTARPDAVLAPEFGAASLARHRASGATRLTVDVPGLRRDVDTVEDLHAALALGCGPRTARAAAAVLARPRE